MKNYSSKVVKDFFLKKEYAIKCIYEDTYRLLMHIAKDILHQKEDSEDVVSFVYESLLNDNSNDEIIHLNYKEFVSYISKMTKNKAIDLYRRNQFKVSLDDSLLKEEEKKDYTSSLLDKVREILTNEEYNVFIYKAYYELDYKNISNLIEKNEGRCRVIYHEAKKKLSKHKELIS